MNFEMIKQLVIDQIAQQTGLDNHAIEPQMMFDDDLGLTEDDLITLIRQLNHQFEDINLTLNDLVENGVDTVEGLIQLVSDELALS